MGGGRLRAAVAATLILTGAASASAAELAGIGTGYGQGTWRYPEIRGAGVVVALRPEQPPAWLTWPGRNVSIQLEAGRLAAGEDRVTAIAAGAAWQFRRAAGDGIGFVDLGIAPTLLSDRYLGELDLGGRLQFTSHVGLGMHFGPARGWTVLWRLQHTSNARLYRPNPGFELQGLELRYDLAF